MEAFLTFSAVAASPASITQAPSCANTHTGVSQSRARHSAAAAWAAWAVPLTVTERLGLEETFKIIKLQPLAMDRDSSSGLLKGPKSTCCEPPPARLWITEFCANLCQGLSMLIVKNFSLMSNLNPSLRLL